MTKANSIPTRWAFRYRLVSFLMVVISFPVLATKPPPGEPHTRVLSLPPHSPTVSAVTYKHTLSTLAYGRSV